MRLVTKHVKQKGRIKKRRVISVVMAIVLAISVLPAGILSRPKEVQAIGAEELAEGAFTLVSGIVNATQSYELISERNNGEMSVSDVFTAIFSDPDQLKMEFMMEDIYEGVGVIDNKVDKLDEKMDYLTQQNIEMNSKINSKLNTVNSKLDQQSQTLSEITDTLDNVLNGQTSTKNQIASMKNTISAQLENQTDTLSVALYNSTQEIKDVTTLMDSISTYYSSFDGLSSVEQTIMKDLRNKQKDYSAFLEAVGALENGSDILRLIDKISVNYDESYASLTEEEQALLDIEITVPGYNKMKIGKFFSDYMSSMHTYMTDTIYEKANGYTSNIYDTAIFMGKYILGQVDATGNEPIGEIYYKLAMTNNSTSDSVHETYEAFRDSILQQYYTTAYLCEISLLYTISYDKAHDGNSSTIKTNQEHLGTLAEQMQRIYAYIDYEEKNCQAKYDFNDYIDSNYHEYLCYYGNTVNAKQGIKNWKCAPKKDVYISGGLSEDNITLSMGELHPLCLYYGTKDVTASAKFTSGDNSVAVVGEDGTICAVASGETTITATYDDKDYTCKVVVGSSIAVPNGTKVSNYHYGDSKYSVKADIGYDYYYNAKGYVAEQVTLSAKKKSAGIEEVTALKEVDLNQFTWNCATQGVAEVRDNQIYNVDAGCTVVYGYRYLADEEYYEYIGIPVVSGLDMSSGLEKDVTLNQKKDYSDYKKISTADDLIALANNPDGWGFDDKYVLTNNIDLCGMEWSSSIGYMYGLGENSPGKDGFSTLNAGTLGGHIKYSAFVPFQGEFDGNGYTISNFKITKLQNQDKLKEGLEKEIEKYKEYNNEKVRVHNDLQLASVGLFGATENARIYNLNVTNANLSLDLEKSESIVTCDAGEVKLTYNSDAPNLSLYAGGMIGYAANNGGAGASDTLAKIYDAENDIVNEEALKLYAPDMSDSMRETIVNETNTNNRMIALSLYFSYLYASEMDDYYLQNCYVDGTIQTKVENNTGGSFIGMLAGCVADRINNCRAAGTIESVGKNGAVGGLVGKWNAHTSYTLSDCISEVTVCANGGDTAGGLIGDACVANTAHSSLFKLSEEDLQPLCPDDPEKPESIAYWKYFLGVMSLGLKYKCDTILNYDEDNQNVRITDCQVLKNVSGEGIAGGLIGTKSGTHKACDIEIIIDAANENASMECDISFYNMDISNCYVVSDVKTTGQYAGGIIGQDAYDDEAETYEPENSETNKETVTTKRGSLKRCYYYGNLSSNKAAAGIVGNVTYDLMDLSSVIVVPYTITVSSESEDSKLIAPALFSDETTQKSITVDNSTIYYYNTSLHEQFTRHHANNTTYYTADDTTYGIAKNTTELNKAETYQALWPDAFLELNVELNTEKGVIPTYLTNRYHFPVDQVRKYYVVGDTFEPLTMVQVNNGVTSQVITEGVTCSAPDMEKAGVRQVTVKYGDYSDNYNVFIYPKQNSYIKVTALPELVEDESGVKSLSGGEITIYNNKGETVAVKPISECTVQLADDNSKFVISYDNMTTCISVVTLSVYSNGLSTGETAELRESIQYIEGSTVCKDQVVKNTIKLTVDEKETSYNLLGSTLPEEEFQVDSDMYVMTLYAENLVSDHEHEYDASFNWEEDGSKCTITLTCQREDCSTNTEGHEMTDDCTVTPSIKKPATCTEKGIITYTATYGEYSDTKDIEISVDASNHAGETEVVGAVAATCKTAGYTGDTKCKGCGEIVKQGEEIEKLTTHSYVNGVCSVCDDIFTTTVNGITYQVVTEQGEDGKPVGKLVNVSENDIQQVAVSVIGTDNNTLTENYPEGKVTISSTVTGSGSEQTFVVTKISDDAFDGASVTEIVVPDTVTEVGNGAFGKAATVTFNGEEAPEGIGNALSATVKVNVPEGAADSYKKVLGENATINEIHTHTYKAAWSYDKTYHWHAATCVHEEEIADKAAHTFGEWIVTKEATEDEKGAKERRCACGYSEEEEIEKLAHVTHIKDKGTRVEPTCEEKGSVTYKCTKCDQVIEVVELDALGHKEETDAAEAATCEKAGKTEGKHCKVCNKILKAQEEVKATGHTWDAGKITKEATETEEGVKTYTCTICGKTKTEAIPQKAATTPNKGDVVADDKAAAKVEVADVTKKEVTYKEPSNEKAKTVTIPTTVKIDGVTYKVTKIADDAFKGNKTITKVTVGSNIKTIGKNAFSGATKLKKVTVGKNVTEIGANAFKGCSSLTSVTLPGKTTKIGAYAFSGCKKLKTLTIQSTKLTSKTVAKNAFKGMTKGTTIKVPKKKLSAYKSLFKKKGLSSKVNVKGY